jgi:hypothetical protein
MEAVNTPETSAKSYQTTLRNIPDDSRLHTCRREKWTLTITKYVKEIVRSVRQRSAPTHSVANPSNRMLQCAAQWHSVLRYAFHSQAAVLNSFCELNNTLLQFHINLFHQNPSFPIRLFLNSKLQWLVNYFRTESIFIHTHLSKFLQNPPESLCIKVRT